MNEASWEELLKESIGGRSNTSAYSLVYIDTSKPEILVQITEDTTGNYVRNSELGFITKSLNVSFSLN